MQVRDVLDSQFELCELVGEGGMGQVFKAKDRKSGGFVAIKTLLPQFASDPTAADELRREVKLSQRLSHVNIVGVQEYRVAGRVPFIVMEFVEGRPLNVYQYEQPNRRLSEPIFRAFADQILDAVGFAHQSHVVHRDLKPANIMVQPSGRLKLMDFGIAAALKATYTRITGHTSGLTIQYASPEQINGDDPAPSMDIYSLGCVFFEMLAGRPPFHQGEILHQHLTKAPSRIADVAPDLNDLVHVCLQKDPAKRPQSTAEVKALLAGNRTVRVARPATVSAASQPPSGIPRATAEPAPRRPASTPPRPRTDEPALSYGTQPSLAPVYLIGAAVILGVIGVIVFGSGSRRSTGAPAYSPPPPSSSYTPAYQPPARTEPVYEPPPAPKPQEPAGPTPAQIRASVSRFIEQGKAAHGDGDYEGARAAFRRALALEPGNKEARSGVEKANRSEKAELELGKPK